VKWIRLLTVVLGVAAIVAGAWLAVNRFRRAQSAADLPVVPARQGEFVVIVRCRGDIKAGRSIPINAPVVPNLRIAWMANAGDAVKEADPIIRFDSSSAEQQLIQKQAALRQSQATLDQAIAQAQITSEHDQSDLRDTQFSLQRAKLQITGSEYAPRIQADQAKIDVGIAEQRVKVQEANIALHAASDKAKVASLTRQRDQAKADVELTQKRIDQMEIRAPIAGYVVFATNYSQGPTNSRTFRVGDNVFAGMNLAEMPDMNSLVMDAKVEEIDRGRIRNGNDARVRIDALAELKIMAQLTSISPLAEQGLEFPPTRSFHAYAALQNPDPSLRPGMNGGMDIIINRLPNAISIPAKAVFTRSGKPIVYVGDKGRYIPKEIQVLARNPDEVAVSGIEAGQVVTLVEPEAATPPSAAPAPAAAAVPDRS
jgi:multidrug efflux pump subunit AcrA (membrane-fusion protein)